MRIVGIDLAAQPDKTYACVLTAGGPRLKVEIKPKCDDDMLSLLFKEADKVAIDAPFGWPAAFVAAVRNHQERKRWPTDEPGAAFDQTQTLSYRATDLALMAERRPLSVAADKLGVTAMRCARALDGWERKTGEKVDRTGAGKFVEVYPACALGRWCFPTRGYKGDRAPNRAALASLSQEFLDALDGRLEFVEIADEALIARYDDAFDALVAALVGLAAQQHMTDLPPSEVVELANVEGWIQVPKKGLSVKEIAEA